MRIQPSILCQHYSVKTRKRLLTDLTKNATFAICHFWDDLLKNAFSLLVTRELFNFAEKN